MSERRGGHSEHPELCRTCTDFKTWSRQQKKNLKKDVEADIPEKSEVPRRPDCPLDRDDLGRNTWSLLHTIAAYYPQSPSPEQKKDIKTFFSVLSRLYPCDYCAEDLRHDLKECPPQTNSQEELSQWLCALHNKVNTKLGKPLFDCKRVNERWKDGWKDGSCD